MVELHSLKKRVEIEKRGKLVMNRTNNACKSSRRIVNPKLSDHPSTSKNNRNKTPRYQDNANIVNLTFKCTYFIVMCLHELTLKSIIVIQLSIVLLYYWINM